MAFVHSVACLVGESFDLKAKNQMPKPIKVKSEKANGKSRKFRSVVAGGLICDPLTLLSDVDESISRLTRFKSARKSEAV